MPAVDEAVEEEAELEDEAAFVGAAAADAAASVRAIDVLASMFAGASAAVEASDADGGKKERARHLLLNLPSPMTPRRPTTKRQAETALIRSGSNVARRAG